MARARARPGAGPGRSGAQAGWRGPRRRTVLCKALPAGLDRRVATARRPASAPRAPPRRHLRGSARAPGILPLSGCWVLVGAIIVVMACAMASNAGATTLAGIAAVAIGTIEVNLREHLSG